MDSLRVDAIRLILDATREQLIQIKNILSPADEGEELTDKLARNDPETTRYIMSLPRDIVVHLFRFLSVEDAAKICRLNKTFDRWCKEKNFMQELRRINTEREQRITDEALRISRLFTGTNPVQMSFKKNDRTVTFADYLGDSGFEIFGKIEDVREMQNILHFQNSYYGFEYDQMRRWYHQGENETGNSPIINRYPLDERGRRMVAVTQAQLDHYTELFRKVLKAGWTSVIDTTKVGNNICTRCSAQTAPMYLCSECPSKGASCLKCANEHLKTDH